jgi:hypothetical protein
MRMWIVLFALSAATPVCAQSSSGASSAMNITNPASTTSKTFLVTPPTVVAPGLTAAGIETCLGSTSGGVSVMGGGFSFGRTMVDDGCTIRLLSRQLYAFGFQKAAMALMCQDEHVAIAMQAVGTPCPAAFAEAAERRQVATAQVAAVGTKPFTPEERAWFDWQSH